MKKKYIRVFSIAAGIIFLLFLIANFGLNFWLKNNLDRYIKNNSNYIVSYKTLNVDLGTGNINATGLTVNNKDPQNQTILGLQGTVDTVSIARLGIYDALFNKRIQTSDLVLNNPNLNITLAKKNNDKKVKKQNDIVLENIQITQGNIRIFKATKQKILSVNDLDLMIENLKLSEESAGEKLPFVLDQYKISGKNLFFRPDNLYAVTAKHISTTDGQMNLKDFALTPLLSYSNFTKFYPKKRNLFDIKSTEMFFADIILKDERITLTKVRLENPDVKMFTTNVKALAKKKPFTNDVLLDNVQFNNAKINILSPAGTPLFSAGNLNLNIDKFLMNAQTAVQSIPFQYKDFTIKGKNINYVTEAQHISISNLFISPQLADIQSISVKPTATKSEKTLLDIEAKHIKIAVKEFAFRDKKLKLNIDNILINDFNGTITGSAHPKKKVKQTFAGIAFPLTVKNIVFKNSNVTYNKENKPLVLKDLNANLQNIELNASTVQKELPFKIGYYNLTARNFDYKTDFYSISSSLLKMNSQIIQLSNFAMLPRVSRAQYIRMIPTEKDLYDIKVNQIQVAGKWDFFSDRKFLEASNVILNGVNANIFRSKIPKDDLTDKPLYSKLLRSIKIPMFINNLKINNSLLVYEEDTKKSDGPGKLTFNNFNLSAKNINSGKIAGKPTKIPIVINCLFMNASPMKVNWNLDTASLDDSFSIAGNISDLPASRINPFIEPYLKVRATGLISDLIFNFKGNLKKLNGTLNMKHTDLKIAIITETGEKNTLLSAVANVFVKSNSGNYPESVPVEDVERDTTKSFFNLFWKGIEQGLKKTLVGLNAPKTEENIKKTISTTKATIEDSKNTIKDVKTDVKEEIKQFKSSERKGTRKKKSAS